MTKYALQEEINALQVAGRDKPVLPPLSNKVLDKYVFAINSSCYLALEKAQRLKTTVVLNDQRINLLKFLVNETSVEVETPELFKTFAFSKDARTEQQLDYLYFYTVVGTQSNPTVIKCGDVISMGNVSFIVREYVDGHERTKYSGQPIDIASMQKLESLLEDSCVLTDPLKSARRGEAICEICRLGEDLLLNKGPLIPMAFEQSYFLCKGCIKSYVGKNIKTEQKGYCLKYSADNLFVPGTNNEFPRNFVIEGKTVDLLNIPKINTTVYIVLERTDYDRPLGHVEGMVLKLHEMSSLTLGSGNQASVKLDNLGIQPVHCTITFENNQYYLHENTSGHSTFIRPYNNPVLNLKDTSTSLRMHDHYLSITYKSQVAATANEFILNDVSFQMPAYSQRENLVPESMIGDVSNLSGFHGNGNLELLDHQGQVKKIPHFSTKFASVSKEAYVSESQESNTL